jgi:hypothetical protein
MKELRGARRMNLRVLLLVASIAVLVAFAVSHSCDKERVRGGGLIQERCK